jgi:hypothetical protein
LLPVLLLGVAIGWLVRAIGDQGLDNGDVLGVATTLYVGWLIQRHLTRSAELSKVPLDAVAKLFDQLTTAITAAMREARSEAAASADLLEQLRIASNEITWLGTVIEGIHADNEEYEALRDAYYRFKEELTGGHSHIPRAALMARQMRLSCLRLQSGLCRHILDNPESLHLLR